LVDLVGDGLGGGVEEAEEEGVVVLVREEVGVREADGEITVENEGYTDRRYSPCLYGTVVDGGAPADTPSRESTASVLLSGKMYPCTESP